MGVDHNDGGQAANGVRLARFPVALHCETGNPGHVGRANKYQGGSAAAQLVRNPCGLPEDEHARHV